MKSKRLFLISLKIILFAIGMHPVSGQTVALPDEIPEEELHLHLSDRVLISGETLWFHIMVMKQGQPSASKIAYVELLDRNGDPVIQQMVGLENGRSEGYLIIPEQLSSDHYLLRAYTRNSPFAENKNRIFHKVLAVIHPQQPPLILEKKEHPATANQNTSAKIIGLEKESFVTSETIPLKVHLLPEATDFLNISITQVLPDFFGDYPLEIDDIYEPYNKTGEMIPELYGHIIQGQLLADRVDTTETFYLSAHGRHSHLFLGKPNKNGAFFFETGAFKYFDYVVVQSSKTEEQVNFILESPYWNQRPKAGFRLPELYLTTATKKFVEDRLLAYATQDYYTPSVQLPTPTIPFQFVTDHSYLLDDYNRFDEMATVIREYVPSVYVRSQNRKTVFKNFNIPYNRLFQENPLILIDGMPVFDSDLFSKFNPRDIKKLDIVNRYLYFQEELFQGVISLTSFNNDFGNFDLPKNALFITYEGIQVPLKYHPAPKENKRIPDFRNVLFWKGGIPTQETIDFEVQSSLLYGNYEIRVSYWDKTADKWHEESKLINIESENTH